jgi:serine phosphatase RsbU (regulator of sigma subunit)/anti-sigma regulatory factor (Ser/Thr protein kinase)/anti-anti-sigma regulatory factor
VLAVTGDDAPVGYGEVFIDLQALVDFFEQRPQYSVVVEGPELRVVAVNKALRELSARREVLGRPLFDVYDEMVGQGSVEFYKRVYETGVASRGREWAVHLRHPDGTDQVYWSNYSISPRWNADGSVIGIWGESEDVTDQVLARQAMEAEMRSLTEQFEQAREVVHALQRALLPDRVPVLPTLDVAGRYLLAADEQAAGGDWFDVLAHDGHAQLVVGDVVGHGVAASATMGQLRAVLLDRLATDKTVAEAVAALDRRARREPGSFAATVCVVDVDLATGDLEYVTAGHPPPLVLDRTADESGRYLEPSGAGPLGTGGQITAGRDRLGDGEIVVLYTDGIVELPGRTPVQGTSELARDARRAVRNTLLPVDAPALAVERIASQVIQTLTRVDGYRDDITLLAAQRKDRKLPLHLRLIADDVAAAVAREALRSWLHPLGARVDDVDALLHAVTELVENVIDHAYDHIGGRCEATADLHDDGTVVVVVRDRGRWVERPADTERRGLGLAMVRGTVDHLDVAGGDTGTTATVRHRLSRDAGVLDMGVRTPAPDEAPFDVWQRATEAGISVSARGPLDARAVPALRSHLAAATAPGRPPATLDLRDVTLLSSAVVQLLLQLLADDNDLRIIAPAGSTAQHVLTLTGLPHTTETEKS